MKKIIYCLLIIYSCNSEPKNEQANDHLVDKQIVSVPQISKKSFCGNWIYSTASDCFTISIKNERDTLFLDYVIVMEHGRTLNASQNEEPDYAFVAPISQIKGRSIGGMIKNYWDETTLPFHLNLEEGDTTLHWSLLSEDIVPYMFRNVRLRKEKNKN